jgi:hypothetical protein
LDFYANIEEEKNESYDITHKEIVHYGKGKACFLEVGIEYCKNFVNQPVRGKALDLFAWHWVNEEASRRVHCGGPSHPQGST